MDLKEFVRSVGRGYVPAESEVKEFASCFAGSLESGSIRAAEPAVGGDWAVNAWVKEGILLLFRFGKMADMSVNNSDFHFFDKDTIPLHKFMLDDHIRIVPGGSSVRCGAYIAPGVIMMPPMYVNIGAYVGEGTMIDSHALVGTCAQIGRNVHLSAASQIGGVLEPAGASPVIVEDGVMIGGNCGVYEGVRIKRRAVLGSGVIITASTKIYDLVNERVIAPESGLAPVVPEGAVVVPGSRQVNSLFARENGLAISAPIIVKYRDEKTDAKTALTEALR